MEIIYQAHSCFQIKGKEATLLTDPFDEATGVKLPKLNADIVTISHDHHDHNNLAVVGGTSKRPEPFVINAPGEYEVGGVSVFGYESFHDQEKGKTRGKNTIYIIHIDGLTLAHLGDLGETLTDEQISAIGVIDVLFIPVGGKYTIDALKAAGLVSKIEPTIAIPMHYRLARTGLDLAGVDDFTLQAQGEKIQPIDKLVVTYDKLPEESKVVVLNARY